MDEYTGFYVHHLVNSGGDGQGAGLEGGHQLGGGNGDGFEAWGGTGGNNQIGIYWQDDGSGFSPQVTEYREDL